MTSYERWQEAVSAVRATLRPATTTQRRLARSAGVELARGTPEVVAAELLKIALQEQLHLPAPRPATAADWSRIVELARRCDVDAPPRPAHRAVATAWMTWLQGMRDVAALRRMRPAPGDLVAVRGRGQLVCEISSMSATGKVNFRGADPPAHAADLSIRLRAGQTGSGGEELREGVTRRLRMRQRTVPDLTPEDIVRLERHVVTTRPGPHEVQRLTDAITLAGDPTELQRLLAEHPVLLHRVASTPTFWVVPESVCGVRCAPPFLVAHRDGEDLAWNAVVLAPARDAELVRDGRPGPRLARAIEAITAWRDWLAGNLDTARGDLALAQIRPDVGGLVLIGQSRYETARQRELAADLAERKHIQVRSYDWLFSDRT